MSNRLPTGPPAPPTSDGGTQRARTRSVNAPVRITGGYLVFALLWIGLTELVQGGAGVPTTGFWAAAGRSAVFVALSALLVFWLSRHEFRTAARPSALLAAVTESTADVGRVKDRIGPDGTEQALVRDALRASERRFRELADAIPQIVWVTGADGGVTYFNARTVEYTGFTCDELTGWAWDKMFYPDDLPRTVAAWTEIVRTGVPRVLEFRLRRADGAYRWHICRQVPARNTGGAVVQWYGTATDVEDLKRAEAALRDERTLLRTLIDALPDLIAVKDAAGRYTVCNRALVAYAGATAEAELLGRTALDLFPADEARVYQEEDARVLARGETIYEHERVVRAGAGWRAVSKVPVMDPAGAVVGLVAIDRNVQQRKEREQALAESQERLKHALMAARMGVWEWDLRTDAIHWSPECLTIYGVDKPGRSIEDFLALVHPDDRDRVMALAHSALENRTGFSAEFRIVRPDGTVRWISDLARGTYAADGRPVRMIGTVQDVTDRRAAEEALREERDRLARLAVSVPGVLHCFRLGPDGAASFPYASPGIATIYGLRPEVLAADAASALEMLHPEDRERVLALIAESARTLTPWKEAYRLCRPGGEIWVEVQSAPVREPDGGTLWYGILSDITGRKRDEAVLRFQNALLTSQTEASPDGVLVVSSDGRVLSHNHRFFAVWGMPEDAAAPGHDALVLAQARSRAADPEAFSARVAAIYADPDIHSRDEVALADGRTLERYSSPIRGAAGEVLGRVWFFRDITDRKRAEAERDRQGRELQLIFDAVPALIFYKDLDHRLVRVNQELVRLSGLPRARIEGRTDAELGSPHADQYYRDEDEVVATGRPKRGLLEPIATATGVRWLRTDKFPLRDEGGRTVGVIGFAQDVTDRMRAESEQQKLIALVQHSKDFIGLADLDGRITFLNAGARRMIGLGEDEDVSGLHFTAYVPPEWQDFFHETALRTVRETGLWEGEMQWRHMRTGRLIDVARTIFLIPDPAGGPSSFATVTRDITARKRAEQTLRDRERMLGIVTGSARVGLAVVNARYEYLFANEAYADLFGLAVTDVVGRRTPDLLATSWDRVRPQLDRALAGERVSFELAWPTAPGAPGPRWFRAMYEPRGADTGPTVVFVIMEITEQKRAEAAIRESEERYRRLVDVLPTALFIHTRDEIVFCNPAFVQLMGASGPAELLGRDPYGVPHPDFREFVRTRVAAMLESGEATTGVEMRVVRLDGRSVPVQTAATPVTGSHPPAVLVALSDLTERERSADLLRAVLASVNDPILTIDERGTVQSANPATERTFGYPEAELIGGSVKKLMPDQYSIGSDRYNADYLRTGVAKVIGIGREATGRRKDGTTFPLELTVTEFRLDGERHFTGVVRDITARKRLEAQFQQAQKMEAIGRLAGGVAHDFNNLLTVINGYTDFMLLELPVGDPRRDAVATVRDAGERAARLTQQLLAFSRKAIVEPKVLDLNELVTTSAKLLGRLIGEDVSLVVVADPALARIKADPGQLEQVLMNLAVNARDAMPTGGRLLIQTRDVAVGPDARAGGSGPEPGRYAQLTVTDSGTGMTDEVKSKIFEPFFTTKEPGKGTGLGLAVVHGVVEQCGGHITVTSAVGAGTTFNLLFPVVAEASGPGASGITWAAARGTETVLLVEDDAPVRAIARTALETQGYKVLDAASGGAAIRLAEGHSGTIHLLVTDVVMPEMGGRKVAEAVRARRPGTRVLYISGYTDDAVVQHGIVEGTDAFLQKPFTPLGLARKVRAVLDAPA
ncbi:PAS domain S-box protein [Frigoriglobus tundricola]|uniref:histidine kinase n=1 Tax=Frigoriglobus tundricola TaxID=2774151 RepID=A0A6M5YJ09_9BACT|nr:PAS domain S-box protein [Frigoriglobus tundricola]QJW93321.1 hypothetical protein FTUN_0827 [Frigoriglobus tundricola]